MHEIKISLQWLMAVTLLFPIVLLVLFFVKDRLRQGRQDDWCRSDDAPGHGELEHSVVPVLIDTVQDKRTEEDRSRLLRQLQELEALEQRLNQLQPEL